MLDRIHPILSSDLRSHHITIDRMSGGDRDGDDSTGGDLGSFSIDQQSQFHSQDSINATSKSNREGDQQQGHPSSSTSSTSAIITQSQSETERAKKMKSSKSKEREREREREIPRRKQGGSLTNSTPNSNSNSNSISTSSHSNPSTSSNHDANPNPDLNPKHPSSSNPANPPPPPRPHRTDSSSNNSLNSNQTNTASTASSSTSSSKSNRANRVGNGLSSVKEKLKLGQGWNRTLGINARERDRQGNAPSRNRANGSSGKAQNDRDADQDAAVELEREGEGEEGEGEGEGDLSIPFSSLVESRSRNQRDDSDFNLKSKRDSNGSSHTFSTVTSLENDGKKRQDQSQSNPSSHRDSKDGSTSSSKRKEPKLKDQAGEISNTFSNLALGNKFGIGQGVVNKVDNSTSSTSSPISPTSPRSPKATTTTIATSASSGQNEQSPNPNPSSPTAKKSSKKRRESKSSSRKATGGEVSEPSSPVPPRRTSLNVSRSDYANLGLDSENRRREEGEERQAHGLGLRDTAAKPKSQSQSNAIQTSNVASSSSSQTQLVSQPKSQSSSSPAPSTPNATPKRSSNPSLDSSISLPLLQRYVLSIGIVNFDLDLGPDLEFLFPPLGISREERDNIAFSSFPDTSIFDDGSCVFSWRVREVPLDSSSDAPPIIGKSKGKEKEVESERSLERNSILQEGKGPFNSLRGKAASNSHHTNPTGTGRLSTNYIYGYVFFRQKRDAKIRRGYFQKSLVILSHLPYVSLFEKLVRILGTLFFEFFDSSRDEEGEDSDQGNNQGTNAGEDAKAQAQAETEAEDREVKILKSFCKNVTLFPEPIPGELIKLELPFLSDFKKSNPKSKTHNHFDFLEISSLIVSIPNSLSSSQTSFLNDGFLLPPSTSAAGRPNSVLISKSKGHNHGRAGSSLGPSSGKDGDPSSRLRNEIGQSKENPLLATIPSRTLFDTFREVLPDLWLLWECLLLADPILIMAPDPSRCSEAIWHAIDLIRPIPFAGDFRPFFTMQDHDVSILVNKNKPQSGTLLGVTNPFFKQACDHWSNTLRVGKGGPSVEEKERLEMQEREREKERDRNPFNSLGSRGFHFHHSSNQSKDGGSTFSPSTAGYSSISQANSMSTSNSIPLGRVAGGNSAGGGGPDHTPGFTTKRKRRVSKDRPLLRRLIEMGEKRDNDLAANALLRRYFSSLTEMFLAPLNRYVSTLIPADFDLSSPIQSPRLKPFSTNDFLTSLKNHGTPIPLKSKNLPTGNNIRQSLYLDFLNCSNFSLWLTERLNQAEEEQRRRRINVLENDDVIQFAKSRGEIESLDLYERLIEEIKRIDEKLNQPISLGPSSRWRTDNPQRKNHEASDSQVSNSSFSSSLSSAPVENQALEQVTSRESVNTVHSNSAKFVDARSSISSSNLRSDTSEPQTPTAGKMEDKDDKAINSNSTLKNETTSSGLLAENLSGKGGSSRQMSNSFPPSSSASSSSSAFHNNSNSNGGQVNAKQLQDRKIKLLKQLEKLAETFPPDLRGSLRVKP